MKENPAIHNLKMVEARVKAKNPVDLATVAELRMAMQRIELGRPLLLDPQTRALYDSVIARRRQDGNHRQDLS